MATNFSTPKDTYLKNKCLQDNNPRPICVFLEKRDFAIYISIANPISALEGLNLTKNMLYATFLRSSICSQKITCHNQVTVAFKWLTSLWHSNPPNIEEHSCEMFTNGMYRNKNSDIFRSMTSYSPEKRLLRSCSVWSNLSISELRSNCLIQQAIWYI